MLSCREVRERLPAISTGERATPEERDHLAACGPCRAEHDRLGIEIERLREGLAELSPSPFLEDQVLENTPIQGEAPRRPWSYVAAALIAAAALVSVLVLERRRQDETTTTPSEQEIGEPRLWVPPSFERVLGARSGNPLDDNPTAEWRWTDATRHQMLHQEALHLGPRSQGSFFGSPLRGTPGKQTISTAFLPPPPGCLHRWVYGDEASSTTVLGPRAAYPLPSGELRLGRRVLDRLGVTEEASFDAHLAAPHGGAAEARVRIRADPAYRNWLAIPAPLAQSLRLYAFELPSGTGSRTWFGAVIDDGRRAWARLRIPELDFNDVIEVEVLPTSLRPGREPDPRIAVTAVTTPSESGWVDRLPGALGPLALRPIKHTHAFVVGVPGGANGVPCLLFAKSRWQPGQLRRLDLRGAWPVGTILTLAQTWRGTTAIPADVSVVRLRVEEEGRARGWIVFSSPAVFLRALVERPDGTRQFQEVRWSSPPIGTPAAPYVKAAIDSEGRLRVGGLASPPAARDWTSLRRAIGEAPTSEPEDATHVESGATLELEVSPQASWSAVERVLEAATAEGFRIVRFADGPRIPFTVISMRLLIGRNEARPSGAVVLRLKASIPEGEQPEIPEGAPSLWRVQVQADARRKATPIIRLLNRLAKRNPSMIFLSESGW